MTTTPTTNLAIAKADAGSGEKFNAAALLNAGWDKVDTAIGPSGVKLSTTTVASSTTETILFSYALPSAAYVASRAYKVVAMGQAGNVVTAVPTLTLRARLGGLTGQIIGTVVITCPAGAQSGKSWWAEAIAVCQSPGTVCSFLGGLRVTDELGAQGTLSALDESVLSAAVTVDTTASPAFVITGQWSASNAANTVSCYSGYGRKEN